MTVITKETIFSAIDELTEHISPAQLLDEAFQALNTDQCAEVLEHIIRNYDMSSLGGSIREVYDSVP